MVWGQEGELAPTASVAADLVKQGIDLQVGT